MSLISHKFTDYSSLMKDFKINEHGPGFHGDIHLLNVADKIINTCDNFIETGTYYGATTKWASSVFEKVITIEASELIFNLTKDDLSAYKNVTHILGDSREILKGLKIIEPAVFWLDAHYSGGSTFQSDNPLINEISLINNIQHPTCILIDDARYITSCWVGEQYCELKTILDLLSINGRYVAIFEDVLFAVPYDIKEVLNSYFDIMSKKYWNYYLDIANEKSFKKGSLSFFKEYFSRVIKKR